MSKPKNWPAYYYGPNGEAEIFQEASQVPADWKDAPQVDSIISGAQFGVSNGADVVLVAATEPVEQTTEVTAVDERAQELFDGSNKKGLYDLAEGLELDVNSKMVKMEIANLLSAAEKAEDNS